jgi:hypothetical protein
LLLLVGLRGRARAKAGCGGAAGLVALVQRLLDRISSIHVRGDSRREHLLSRLVLLVFYHVQKALHRFDV